MTLGIARWLRATGWRILALVPPSGGSGYVFHVGVGPQPRGNLLDSWVPDIVAIRGDLVVCFENKPVFDPADVAKIERLRADPRARELAAEATGVSQDHVAFGLGFHSTKTDAFLIGLAGLVTDFMVRWDGNEALVISDPRCLFLTL